VTRVYKPYFVFFPRIRPKFVCLKAVVVALFQFYLIFSRFEDF
jgi:hypothetical protein